MKTNLAIAGFSFLFFSLISSHALGAKFLWKDERGAHIYGCSRSCGKVSVKKTANGVFRIYSILYSGDIEASSEKRAAMKACREILTEEAKKEKPAEVEEYG